MAFLKTQRSKFIAWMFIYAFAVMLMFSKGGDEGTGFVWGLGLGVGAGIATCVIGPEAKWRRFLTVVVWFLGCFLFGLLLHWSEMKRSDSLLEWKWIVGGLLMTLIVGGPALLALLIWIFRRPKLT